MTPLNCQAMASILLLVLPTASCLVPSLSIRHIQSTRNINVRKIVRDAARKTTTQLSLGIDPADIVAQNAHLLHLQYHAAPASSNDPASALDLLSTFTLAKASSVLPNQSLSPLSETIKSASENPNMVEVIPDLPSMPGGAPRSGNAFLAESFRDLYGASIRSNPQVPPVSLDGALSVPAREWDVTARYADLLNRIPMAATVYALVDFFLINAEEDVSFYELMDDEEVVEAIVEVENQVVLQRIVGLFLVVAATVAWSYLTYHPVPFNEL